MARRKRPDDETPEETTTRRLLETVADGASRSEKVSWQRKMDNMNALLAKLTPIEERITAALAEKVPIMDAISCLRLDMVHECVHPFDELVLQSDGTIQCKFCMKNFKVLHNERR